MMVICLKNRSIIRYLTSNEHFLEIKDLLVQDKSDRELSMKFLTFSKFIVELCNIMKDS